MKASRILIISVHALVVSKGPFALDDSDTKFFVTKCEQITLETMQPISDDI